MRGELSDKASIQIRFVAPWASVSTLPPRALGGGGSSSWSGMAGILSEVITVRPATHGAAQVQAGNCSPRMFPR